MSFSFDQPSMDWSHPETYSEFLRFRQHVDFVFKGPLCKADKKDKAGWLGIWIGKQGREIYKTFDWDDGEEDDPKKILDKFDVYVRPRKNKRAARFKVMQRKQKEGESFDNFVKDLRLILMDCEYADTDDILIDAIIAGVAHKKVQERLLDQGQGLNLAKTLDIGRQYEMSQSQLKLIRGSDEIPISKLGSKQKKPETRKHDSKIKQKTEQVRNTCTRCGFDANHSKCPAVGTTCNYCKKPDHWRSVCMKRNRAKMYSLEPEDLSNSDDCDEDAMIDILSTSDDRSDTRKSDKWLVTLYVHDRPLEFRIDTGAKCNVIIMSQYIKADLHGNEQKSQKILRSFTNHKICPEFCVDLPLTSHIGDTPITTKFEVVNVSQENIITGSTAEKLNLIMRVDTVECDSVQLGQFSDFPDLIRTTGTLPGEHKIKIDEHAKGVIHPVRRQPASLKPRIIEKLREMESDGYIVPVEEPTEWVSSMVVSLRNNKVRICIDPKDLNEVIKREHHPMKTVEEVSSSIPGAKVFSVLDAKSGYMQIKLDNESSYLTTFNTPIGRFRWLRLPFGIKSAPEIYQRIMDQMLEGIEGAFAIMDDILIAGRDREHHDHILEAVIKRATEFNLRLNFDKCRVRKTSVPYIGHIISSKGISPDPEKIKAVCNMPAPTNKDAVRRFLGLVQYLCKFIPNMSEIDAPLRQLLKADIPFQWDKTHQESFDRLKTACTTAPVLGLFDVSKPTEIQCDASKDGLGAILMQEGRVIAYSSRALTETEKRYAQIEKEMLSVVHGASKFHCYIFGKPVTVYNDHKPLEQIFKKPILSVPMRLQKMLLKLQWYDFTFRYRKGKDMAAADALSRAFLPNSEPDLEIADVKAFDLLSVSRERQEDIKERTLNELQGLYTVIINGWPDTKNETPVSVRDYWTSRSELSVMDGVIFKGMRIVIPPTLRSHMLSLIHKSHLGIVKCKQRAREVMYWPGMNSQIEQLVKDCEKCATFQNSQPPESLKPTPVPDLPYAVVGCDLFDFESKKYLVVVDYFSKYIDCMELQSQSSFSTIETLKCIFGTHGIPKEIRSDNGPQFSSYEFRNFCNELDIKHVTSSPHFQSSNGAAERAVQTVKRLWRKSVDKQLALLDYRTTPLEEVNLSPSQLLMGRRPRNTLPAASEILRPKSQNLGSIKQGLQSVKDKQKVSFDNKWNNKELLPLYPTDPVRVKPQQGEKEWIPGVIVRHHEAPRSYMVQVGNRQLRRNRKHLRSSTHKANETIDDQPDDGKLHVESPPKESSQEPTSLTQATTNKTENSDHTQQASTSITPKPNTTRSGRRVIPPKKLDL